MSSSRRTSGSPCRSFAKWRPKRVSLAPEHLTSFPGVISRCEPEFWDALRALDPKTRAAALTAYRLWKTNPSHPSLRFKRIEGLKR